MRFSAIMLPIMLAAPLWLLGQNGVLELKVNNVRTPGGTLWVGVYASETDFLDRERARLVRHEVGPTGRERIHIDGLVPGRRYALAVFHDENDNGELDRNLLGLPAEPWAMSRPLRSLLRMPTFAEMSFVFDARHCLPPLRLK